MHLSGKRLTAVLLAMLGLLSLITAVYFATAQTVYTIYDGDEGKTAVGDYDTIAALLEGADITLRPEDIVQPALAETPDPDNPIQIYRAVPITVRTEEETRTIWSAQRTLGAFLLENNILPARNDQLFADGTSVLFNAIDITPLPSVIEIGSFHTITIQDGGNQQTVRSSATTVGDALAEANITVYAADGVEPPLGSWLTADMHISVNRAFPLTIYVDDQVVQTRTHGGTVLEALAEAGIGLVGGDFTRPPAESPITANSEIVVVRVTEDFRLEDVPLPFQTIWQASADLLIDTKAVVSAGVTGIQRQRVRVRYENGVEVSQEMDGEWTAREPVDEIIGYGTRIEIGVVQTEEGPREYWRKMEMRVTSYTAATSGKEPDHPAYGITASGVMAGYGVVGVDRSVVPFLSELYIPEYGIGFVGDTGGGIHGRWVDLGFDEDAYEAWWGTRMIYWLTPVPPAEDINYLIPEVIP